MEIDHLPQLSLLEDGSMYELEGRQYDRVTDIIAEVLPPYLAPWAEGIGVEAACRIYKEIGYLPTAEQIKRLARERGFDARSRKDAGGERGKAIHTCLERYIKYDEIPNPRDAEAEHVSYVQSLARFLLDYRPEFGASELTVFENELGYAGTVDAYGTITRQPSGARHPKLRGKKVILDTKTNAAARTYFPQHHYQLAGYRRAWDTLGLPRVDHEIVVAIGPASEGVGHYQVAVNYVSSNEFPWIVHAYRSLRRAKASNPRARKKWKAN